MPTRSSPFSPAPASRSCRPAPAAVGIAKRAAAIRDPADKAYGVRLKAGVCVKSGMSPFSQVGNDRCWRSAAVIQVPPSGRGLCNLKSVVRFRGGQRRLGRVGRLCRRRPHIRIGPGPKIAEGVHDPASELSVDRSGAAGSMLFQSPSREPQKSPGLRSADEASNQFSCVFHMRSSIATSRFSRGSSATDTRSLSVGNRRVGGGAGDGARRGVAGTRSRHRF